MVGYCLIRCDNRADSRMPTYSLTQLEISPLPRRRGSQFSTLFAHTRRYQQSASPGMTSAIRAAERSKHASTHRYWATLPWINKLAGSPDPIWVFRFLIHNKHGTQTFCVDIQRGNHGIGQREHRLKVIYVLLFIVTRVQVALRRPM